MLDLPAAPPPASAAVVVVPTVATTASDGLPPVLRMGGYRVSLPVWEAPNADQGTAAIVVAGAGSHACSPVDLRPGQVVRVSCQVVVRRGSTGFRVTVVAGGQVVRSWQHVVR